MGCDHTNSQMGLVGLNPNLIRGKPNLTQLDSTVKKLNLNL